MDKFRYVAYRHVNGTIHVKQVTDAFGPDLVAVMVSSPLVAERTEIYDADSFGHAVEIAKQRLMLDRQKAEDEK